MENTHQQTEEYALAEEKYFNTWSVLHSEKLLQYEQKIDANFAMATPEAYSEILKLFSDEEFLTTYIITTKMYYLYIVAQIYREEINAGEKFNVMQLGKNSDTIIEFLHELKFLLWRIEFAKDDEADRDFLNFIVNNNISCYAIQRMIIASSYDIMKVSIHILNIFTSNNMLHHTYQLLKYINKLDYKNMNIKNMLDELERVFRKDKV